MATNRAQAATVSVGESGKENCPFEHALEMLSRRHALEVLWTLRQKSPRRFTEIRRALAVNPVTLTDRLGELEACDVLDRHVFNETPPRVTYDLTPKGRELLVLLDHIEAWSRKYPDRKAGGGPR